MQSLQFEPQLFPIEGFHGMSLPSYHLKKSTMLVSFFIYNTRKKETNMEESSYAYRVCVPL